MSGTPSQSTIGTETDPNNYKILPFANDEDHNETRSNGQGAVIHNPIHDGTGTGGKRRKSTKRHQKKSKTSKKLQKIMGGKSGKKRHHKKNKSTKK